MQGGDARGDQPRAGPGEPPTDQARQGHSPRPDDTRPQLVVEHAAQAEHRGEGQGDRVERRVLGGLLDGTQELVGDRHDEALAVGEEVGAVVVVVGIGSELHRMTEQEDVAHP